MAPVLHMLAGEPGEDNPKLRKAVCRLTVYVADHCMERFLCRYYKGRIRRWTEWPVHPSDVS